MPAAIKWTDLEVEQFQKLCGIFCTKSEVCSIMGIADHRSLDRLIEKHLPDTPTWHEAFEHYSGTGRASLRRRQFEAAMDGSVPMLIFLGKNYLGQSDTGAKVEAQKQEASRLTIMTHGAKFSKAANG